MAFVVVVLSINSALLVFVLAQWLVVILALVLALIPEPFPMQKSLHAQSHVITPPC